METGSTPMERLVLICAKESGSMPVKRLALVCAVEIRKPVSRWRSTQRAPPAGRCPFFPFACPNLRTKNRAGGTLKGGNKPPVGAYLGAYFKISRQESLIHAAYRDLFNRRRTPSPAGHAFDLLGEGITGKVSITAHHFHRLPAAKFLQNVKQCPFLRMLLAQVCRWSCQRKSSTPALCSAFFHARHGRT